MFRHNDVADLERQLAAIEPGWPKLVAFDSVYSRDGDIALVGDAVLCKRASDALLLEHRI